MDRARLHEGIRPMIVPAKPVVRTASDNWCVMHALGRKVVTAA